MLDQLDVFYGGTSDSSAQIYARVAGLTDTAGLSLGGTVRGPECELSRTLPATFPLRDMEPGPTMLARAALPDPCFWSPDMPSLYRVNVELRRSGRVLETAERLLGIRMFGPRGRSLFLEGQRWVLRGVVQDEVMEDELTAWREASAAMIVSRSDETLCRDAARLGVMLVVSVTGSRDEVICELRRLAQSAAVAIAVVENTRDADEQLRYVAPNVLLAQHFPAASPVVPASWADVLICEVSQIDEFARRVADCKVPVIALRRLGGRDRLSDARAACDRLQRDLAPVGDFAGYVV